MSVALDSARKTVARASYAMYAGQLFPTEVTSSNPAGTYYTYIAYRWVDTNNDGFAQKAEILTNLGPAVREWRRSEQPRRRDVVNTIDPDYKANHDHEFIVGLDHELGRNMAVGAAYTWRRGNLWPSWNPRQGLTSADYFAQDPQTFQGYTVQAFAPDPDLVDAFGGGRILSNRPDYHTSYKGLELTFNKRFSNRWMSRVAFSLMDWSEHFDGPGAVQNPTRSDSTVNAGLLGVASGPQVDGGQVAPRSSGSGKGDIFYNARWQLNASGLYQIPWAIDLGASLFGRQGYARPYVIAASAGRDGTIRTRGDTRDRRQSLRQPVESRSSHRPRVHHLRPDEDRGLGRPVQRVEQQRRPGQQPASRCVGVRHHERDPVATDPARGHADHVLR